MDIHYTQVWVKKREDNIVINREDIHNKIRTDFVSDCSKCFGLCCSALFFAKEDGFPHNKIAGVNCMNLGKDYRCKVHEDLVGLGYRGCIAYDCLGAGQKTADIVFRGMGWNERPEDKEEIFSVFLVVRQLHEWMWYLMEAREFSNIDNIHLQIEEVLEELWQTTKGSPKDLLELDLDCYWKRINEILIKASCLKRGDKSTETKLPFKFQKIFGERADLSGKDLRKYSLAGTNLRGACLIAADLRGMDLARTDFIGADFRDTDLRGADLSKSLFVKKAQINVAKCNEYTKLPKYFL